MTGFRVLLDACVLVPIAKADLLLTLAENKSYFPLWSDRILDEVARAIPIATRQRVPPAQARWRVDVMDYAFEDACVHGWEPFEESIRGMPDPDDRHVVAAAVRGSASAIVTDNVRAFPDTVLDPLGLHVRSSERFLLDLLHRNPEQTLACVQRAAGRHTRPPTSPSEFLDSLVRGGVPNFALEARELLSSGPKQ